jgi:hypothetical protein
MHEVSNTCLGENINHRRFFTHCCGWLGITHVTIVTTGAWGFPHPVTSASRKNLSFRVKRLLLPNFNQKWYMSTNFRRSPQYQVSSKSVQSLLKVAARRRHGEAMRHISVNFSYIHTKKKGYKSII